MSKPESIADGSAFESRQGRLFNITIPTSNL